MRNTDGQEYASLQQCHLSSKQTKALAYVHKDKMEKGRVPQSIDLTENQGCSLPVGTGVKVPKNAASAQMIVISLGQGPSICSGVAEHLAQWNSGP